MAGGDDFQRSLNRSSKPTGTPGSSVGGGNADQAEMKAFSGSGNDMGVDHMKIDFKNPSPNPIMDDKYRGKGSFYKQVAREKYLEDNDIAQGGSSSVDKYQQYIDFNKGNQSPERSDGSSIANKYVANAKAANPINVQALDYHIRRAPMYDKARSEMEGLKTYGDMYRFGREELPNWSMPTPMEGVEKPDFDGIYNKVTGDIKKAAD